MLHEGDEWVTSETKWITAVICRYTDRYSVMGDELTSSVKILFFLSVKICNTTRRLLCLRWSSVVSPFQVRFKSVPMIGRKMGFTWDYLGLTWESVLWLALAWWASAKKSFRFFRAFCVRKRKRNGCIRCIWFARLGSWLISLKSWKSVVIYLNTDSTD